MKDKKKTCPYCKKLMKYKGSRTFECFKCGRIFTYLREVEPRKKDIFSTGENYF